jgi:ribosomal protein S18 acetylase RimI-like enzyme
LVGAVCGRREYTEQGVVVYIMTLGVLTPYRSLGFGTKLIQAEIETCRKMKDVRKIYLHVQTSNEEAVGFYSKFGFKIRETLEGYYTKLNPSSAHILELNLETSPEETQ